MTDLKAKILVLQDKYTRSTKRCSYLDAIDDVLKIIDPPKQRAIHISSIRHDGPYELRIKAICAAIRYKSSFWNPVQYIDPIKTVLSFMGVLTFSIKERVTATIEGSTWSTRENFLIDAYMNEDKITILMSVMDDESIRFSVGVNTDSLWYMPNL